MMPMTYTLNDALVVKFNTDLDAGNIKAVRDDINLYSELGRDIVIDLEKVNFIDSSGVGAIVFLYKRLIVKEHNVVIIGLKGQPEQLFKMLQLDRTLPCYDTMVEYVNAVNEAKQKVS